MRMSGPVLDAADVPRLTAFYERLLGWEVVAREGPRDGYPPGDGWALLRPADGSTKIEIQGEPMYERPTWPAAAGEQQMMIHLDILTPNLDDGVAWAIECGAEVCEAQPQKPGDHVIMRDPAGHVFCMCRGED